MLRFVAVGRIQARDGMRRKLNEDEKMFALAIAGIMLITMPNCVEAQTLEKDSVTSISEPIKLEQESMGFELEDAEYLGEYPESGISTCSSPNSVTVPIEGTIGTENGLAYVNVTLGPTQILQATLEGPQNEELDYDMYLYTYDDDGNLDAAVSASKLTTCFNDENGVEKSVDEAISYINQTSSSKTYALLVHAKKGYSDTEKFTLTISLDEAGYYDSYEPNDNPFFATELESTLNFAVGANLNVSNDKDWYTWEVPYTLGKFRLSVDNSYYKVSVYYATSDYGMKLIEPGNDGGYTLVSSYYYYLCVENAGEDFISDDYLLSVSEYGGNVTVSQLEMKFDGDMGWQQAAYSEGEKYRFQNSIKIGIFTHQAGLTDQPVELIWQSGATGEVQVFRGTIGEYGSTTIRATLPEAKGDHLCSLSGALNFIHRYDIDTLTVRCGSSTTSLQVYHFKESYQI